ncbi:MAG: hypothetical protein P1U56_08125 [Saprospiraceae bacterium]|nr:hypothetical protein [Saprospiraceae bacterium]
MENLKRILSETLAGNGLLIIFGFLFLFHLLVLVGVIPYSIVWAGKIKDRIEMIQLESVSLFILAMATMTVLLKMRYVDFDFDPKIIKVGMWVFFVFFMLNTIGNLTAINPIEKYGFGLLTLVMALLSFRLAITS